MYHGLFATAPMPNASGKALVAKFSSRDSMKPGDLILIEFTSGEKKTREIRALCQVERPDTPKAGGRRRGGRAVAQAILDMDYASTFYVSPTDLSDTNNLVRITESQIRGKVIHVLKP